MIDDGTSFEASKHKHLLQCLDVADFQMKPTPQSTGKTHDVPTDHALYQIIDQNWHLSFLRQGSRPKDFAEGPGPPALGWELAGKTPATR